MDNPFLSLMFISWPLDVNSNKIDNPSVNIFYQTITGYETIKLSIISSNMVIMLLLSRLLDYDEKYDFLYLPDIQVTCQGLVFINISLAYNGK